ncbi:MAG: acyl-CoA thioesterase [Sphingomonadaceae bacterium]
MIPIFEMRFTAGAEDIDRMGHVNNTAWVRWMEEVATAHWEAAARPAHRDAYLWVVTRHEIDYLRPLAAGHSVTARSWADPDGPKGACFTRHIEFAGDNGAVHVRARTRWAMVDAETLRPLRISKEIAAPFLHG